MDEGEKKSGNQYFSVPGHTPVILRSVQRAAPHVRSTPRDGAPVIGHVEVGWNGRCSVCVCVCHQSHTRYHFEVCTVMSKPPVCMCLCVCVCVCVCVCWALCVCERVFPSACVS